MPLRISISASNETRNLKEECIHIEGTATAKRLLPRCAPLSLLPAAVSNELDNDISSAPRTHEWLVSSQTHEGQCGRDGRRRCRCQGKNHLGFAGSCIRSPLRASPCLSRCHYPWCLVLSPLLQPVPKPPQPYLRMSLVLALGSQPIV